MRAGPRRPSADWISLGLLILLFMVSGMGLVTADWTDHLSLVPAVGVLAVIAGAALAASRFPAGWGAIFSTVYGLFTVGWQVGRVLDPGLTWRERVLSLLGRVGVFVSTLVRGGSNIDLLMFVVLMGLVFWGLGSVAGWVVFRRQGLWGAVLPAGLALLINVFYYIGRAALNWYLALYVLLTLLLALRLYLVRRRAHWRSMWAQVPPNVLGAIAPVGMAVALMLVILAWGGPAFAQSDAASLLWTQVSRPWSELRDRMGDAFGELRSPLVQVSDFYGSSLSLEAGVEPANTLVMDVIPEQTAETEGPYYWRSRTYNRYESGQWSSTLTERVPFDPEDGDLRAPTYAARREVEFTFLPRVPALSALYLPGQPTWVNRMAVATVQFDVAGQLDVSSFNAVSVVVEGETYRARGSVALPTADELRLAGTGYPAWVTDLYRELPDTLPERVRALAQQIAAGYETPYDQASAITRWLRMNITYRRVTDPPPQDTDPIDWFLFDYRIGFCNYYASAEVVLLRSLGIPARMAVGYASGMYQASEGLYEVRGGDAHAWPEVFFPGYGWVEFEPTSSLAAIIRPEAAASGEIGPGTEQGIEEDFAGDFPGNRFDEEFFTGQEAQGTTDLSGAFAYRLPEYVTWVALGLAFVLLAGTGIRMWLDPFWQAVVLGSMAQRLRKLGVQPPRTWDRPRPRPISPTDQTYLRFCLWLGRLAIPLASAQTPFERAEALAGKMPAGRDAAWTIVQQYAGERFGGVPADEAAVRGAWASLRVQIWIAWLKRALEPLQEITRRPLPWAPQGT